MAFKGDLSTIGLAEVFQMISLSQKEGTLVVQDAESRKCIYFGPQGIQLLSTGRRKGLRLGDMLVRAGKIAEAALNEALEASKVQKKLLGEVLVDGGFVAEKDIQDVVRVQIEEEIYDLFLWKKASFEFLEGPPSMILMDPEARVTKLSFDVNGLLLEAVRRADEWDRINQKIPTLDSVFVFVSEAQRKEEDKTAPDELRRVYRLLNGQTSVLELADGTGLSKFDVCKGLIELIDRGRIRFLNGEEVVNLAARRMSEGAREKALRLYQAAAVQGADDPRVLEKVARILQTNGVTRESTAHFARAGRLFLERGDLREALETTEKAVELSPEDAGIKMGLFEIHAAAGNWDPAKEVARSLVTADLMGQEYGRARTLCDRVLAQDPSNVEFRVLRAKVFHRTQQKKELDEDLAFIYKNIPVNPAEADKVLRALREMGGTPSRVTSIRKAARSRWKRKVVRPALAAAALAALGFGVKYELDARRVLTAAIADADHLEQQQMYAQIRKPLDDYLAGPYRFSLFQAARAREALRAIDGRMQTWEKDKKARDEREAAEALLRMKGLVEAIEAEKIVNPSAALRRAEELRVLAEKWKQEEYLRRAEESDALLRKHMSDALDLRRRADQFEAEGKFREAAPLIRRLLADYPNTDAAFGALYPLAIRTRPAGVKVTLARTNSVIGTTPPDASLKFRMREVESIRLLFEKAGYEPVEREVKDKTVGEIFVELTEKREAWVMPLGISITGEPTAVGDAVYVAGGNTLFALAPGSRELRWKESLDGEITGSPRVAAGRVCVATNRGTILALDSQRPPGKRVFWTYAAGKPFSGAVGLSPDGATLFAGTADRMMHAVDAATGEGRWKREMPGEARVEPIVVSGGLIAACEDGTMVSWKGARFDDEAWKIQASGSWGPVLAAEGSLFAASADQNLYAIDAARGKVLWKSPFPAGAPGRPARAGGRIAVAGKDGKLYLLSAETGETAATFETQGSLQGGVAAAAGVFFFGSDDQRFYAVEGASGALRWKMKAEGKLRSLPVAVSGRLYFGSEKSLYAVDLD